MFPTLPPQAVSLALAVLLLHCGFSSGQSGLENTIEIWKVYAPGFLESTVDEGCFRECVQHWLPHEADKLRKPDSESVAIDPSTVLRLSSAEICSNSSKSRAFQRCYISSCGGLYAAIPGIDRGDDEGDNEDKIREDENKLWSFSSALMARYGPGASDFEDYRFQDDGAHSWSPIPIGVTAACFRAPDDVFSDPGPRAQNDNLAGMKARLATDDRWMVPQAIRRLLVPIWTSPNLLFSWSYNLQLWQLDNIDEPRTLSELREKIIATYLFSFIAFAHLLSISSKSRRYTVESLQLVAFCLIPLFPATYIFHGILDAAARLLGVDTWEWSFLVAGASGLVIYQEPSPNSPGFRARLLEMDMMALEQSSVDPRDGKWLLRLLGIIVNLGVLLSTIICYFIRLNYTHHQATFCAATGFDHRVGWIATCSAIPISATLALHLLDKKWKLWSNVPTNSHPATGDWRTRLALDLTAAAVILEALIMLTGRVSVIQVVLGRLLKDKLGIVTAFVVVGISVLVSAREPLLLVVTSSTGSNKPLQKSLPWLALALAFAYSLLVFLLQIFLDMEEYADLAVEFVLPWNYRWQVPNPSWSKWWGL